MDERTLEKKTKRNTRTPDRCLRILVLLIALALSVGSIACEGSKGEQGEPGPPGPPGPPGQDAMVDNGTSLESCIGCHGPDGAVPVGDIDDEGDAHFIDRDPDGPLTPSGYRQLDVIITSVDLRDGNVEIDFDVEDENGDPVNDIFAGDGRFTIAKLLDGDEAGDPNRWQSLIETIEDPGGVGDGPGVPEKQATSERFTTSGGSFEALGGGSYRYTSAFDPETGDFPAQAGETMRVAIQLSAGDIPAGNGWCDFDASLTNPSNCSGGSKTRDIVQTTICNECHGATSDVKLAIHGGGRTEVEYCVTCHNPGTKDANSGNSVDLTVLVHKIHQGSGLANGYKIWGFRNSLHDYSNVNFTKDIDYCVVCHSGGGDDEDNWKTTPSRQACGACHDEVNFDTGENHANGVVAPGNEFCINCHESGPAGIEVVHRGQARKDEADLYAGGGNGFVIEDVMVAGSKVVLDFSVWRDGGPMDLAADPEWTAGGGASRLAIVAGWNTFEYTNEGSGSTPGLPISINGLDVGGVIEDNLDGTYTTEISLPSSASDTITLGLEGHPAADLDGDGTYGDRIAVINNYVHVDIEGGRAPVFVRDDVIDIGKCNACHDAAGQGISLHGNNRTSEMQVCVICHNPDATDINRRPADPGDTADGKVEESIHMNRLIHQIHSGSELQNGIVIYGFGGSEHDFSEVDFIGNRANCETCHESGTYSTEDAWDGLGSTISTGDDPADPEDDLNISPTAAVCSSCHDDDIAQGHMVRYGASFKALDEDIR